MFFPSKNLLKQSDIAHNKIWANWALTKKKDLITKGIHCMYYSIEIKIILGK